MIIFIADLDGIYKIFDQEMDINFAFTLTFRPHIPSLKNGLNSLNIKRLYENWAWI